MLLPPITAKQAARQQVNQSDWSVSSWSMTVFPYTNYGETVVQLCGGLALSHTIRTAIDWQSLSEGRKSYDEVRIEDAGTLKLPNSFCWSNDACSHIQVLICLLLVCLYSYVCKCLEKAERLGWKVTGLPHSCSLFLSVASSDPANYRSLTEQERKKEGEGEGRRQTEGDRGKESVFQTMKLDSKSKIVEQKNIWDGEKSSKAAYAAYSM